MGFKPRISCLFLILSLTCGLMVIETSGRSLSKDEDQIVWESEQGKEAAPNVQDEKQETTDRKHNGGTGNGGTSFVTINNPADPTISNAVPVGPSSTTATQGTNPMNRPVNTIMETMT